MRKRAPQECLTAALEELRAARAPSEQLRRDRFAERVRRREEPSATIANSSPDGSSNRRRSTSPISSDGNSAPRPSSAPTWTSNDVDWRRTGLGSPRSAPSRQAHPSPGSPAPGSLTYELITLDTAAEIVVPPTADGVAVYELGAVAAAQLRQHRRALRIPGTVDVRVRSGKIATAQVDFMFAFTAQHDMQLNALTFVQPQRVLDHCSLDGAPSPMGLRACASTRASTCGRRTKPARPSRIRAAATRGSTERSKPASST